MVAQDSPVAVMRPEPSDLKLLLLALEVWEEFLGLADLSLISLCYSTCCTSSQLLVGSGSTRKGRSQSAVHLL